MKRYIKVVIAILGILLLAHLSVTVVMVKKATENPTSEQVPYNYVENLNGIGCLRIGMTISEAKKALDSLYLSYGDYLRKNYNRIDYVRIKRNEMLKQVEPLFYKAPSAYTPNHKEYEVTLIFSEDFAVDEIKAYFWADTLYRIHIPNSIIGAQDIGKGLLKKYGEGIGYYNQTRDTEDQLYRWGNDNVIATYRGKTTYNLNSQGIASGVASWFHEVEIIKNDLELTEKIEDYLNQADSLWQAKKDAERYKNL